MSDQQVPFELLAMAESAGAAVFRTLKLDRSLAALVVADRKLNELLDQGLEESTEKSGEIPACKVGCNHCCHYVVFVSIVELAAIVDRIETCFDDAQRQRLLAKLEAYERTVFPAFGKDVAFLRPQCPLLEGSICSVYESRPLRCRGVNSPDPSLCERRKNYSQLQLPMPGLSGLLELAQAASRGASGGIARAGMFNDVLDLGKALAIVFHEPNAIERHLAGEPTLLPAIPMPPVPAVILHNQSWDRPASPEDQVAFHAALFAKCEEERAWDALTSEHPAVLFSLLTVPGLYDSESHIDEWQHRFEQGLNRIAQASFNPTEAYALLPLLQTSGIAYHHRPERRLLSRLGDLINDRIAIAIAPQLLEPPTAPRRPGKLRVGYIGCNLSNSNGGHWALGWLRHQKQDFETYALFLGDRGDEVTMAFSQQATHFRHLTGDPLRNAQFVRSLDLDVLIYPEIGLAGRNYQYACFKLARIQCTAWGHPVTSGLPTIDCYLSSELMEPEDGDLNYREKLIRLPGSGLCFHKKPTPKARMTRSDFGVGDDRLLLSCQNPMKYRPANDVIYRDISDRTGQPIVFLEGVGIQADRLKGRMERAGVRAKWIPTLGPSEFLSLINHSDLCIDSPGWNGGNTTLQALDLGVPVVTLVGETMKGRHGKAFLTLAGVGEAVVNSAADFIELICDRDRIKTAMATSAPEALFEDEKPAQALNNWIRSQSLEA